MTITTDRTAMTAIGKGCPPISVLASVLLGVVVLGVLGGVFRGVFRGVVGGMVVSELCLVEGVVSAGN